MCGVGFTLYCALKVVAARWDVREGICSTLAQSVHSWGRMRISRGDLHGSQYVTFARLACVRSDVTNG